MLYEPLDPRKMGEFDYLLRWIVLLSDPGILSALELLLLDLRKLVGEKEKIILKSLFFLV
jgi:hypothetical protein